MTVSAPGFTGTLSVNGSGVVSIANANVGVHTVTVTGTDACGATVQRTFTLTVGCGGEVSLVPDGRATTLTLATGTTHFAFAATSGRSYVAHVAATVASASPGTTVLLADTETCGAASSTTGVQDVSAVEPALTNGTRLSVVADVPLYRLRVTNPGAPLPVLVGVSETTLFSPVWSTGATFDTYYSVQNTTSATLHATLVLTDAAGVDVVTSSVGIPPGRTAAVNTIGLSAPRNRTGVARLVHDGPPGGLVATAAILNLGSAPPYVQPVKFITARERR
jgi:hypothetical protein